MKNKIDITEVVYRIAMFSLTISAIVFVVLEALVYFHILSGVRAVVSIIIALVVIIASIIAANAAIKVGEKRLDDELFKNKTGF